jgi:hypothetical protein
MASTLDGTVNFAQSLTITAGGAVNLTGPIGASVPLANLTINNGASGVNLPALSVQTLNVTTTGGITSTGNTVVTGATVLAPGVGQNAALTQAGNNFSGTVSVTNGANVTLVDSNAIDLGPITISGDLAVTATTGDITGNGGALDIDGNSTFTANAAGASITLNNAANNFTGTVTFAPANGLANVSIFDTNAFDLVGGLTLSGTLNINAQGPITDTGPTTVSGLSTFNANGNSITLDNAGNNFASVQLNGSNITLFNVSTLNIAGVTSTGALTLQSGGSLNIDAAVVTNGNITLTAGQSIIASAPGTISTGGGFLTTTAGVNTTLSNITTSGGAVTVNAPGITSFIGPVSAGSLLTDAAGSTQFGGGQLTVSNFFRFNDAVTLTAATTLSGPTGRFNSILNGTQALTVNLTGDAVFIGAVGGGNQPLASITTGTSGAMRFHGGVVATTGSQTYNNAVGLGEHSVFTASNLTFNNTLDNIPLLSSTSTLSGAEVSFAASGQSNLTANVTGNTVFMGVVGAAANGRLGAVVTDSSGATFINANFNATSVEFRDAVTIANPSGSAIIIDTLGTQIYTGPVPVQLNTNLIFNSAHSSTTEGITFSQGINAPGRTLTVTAPSATVASVGNLGTAANRLSSVSIHGRNVILGGDVFTDGDIAVAIGTGVGSANDVNGINDFLQFTVPGSNPASPRPTTIDSANGEIRFGSGAVGGAADLQKSAVPLRASIFKTDFGDLYLLAKKITLQPNERMAVRNGSLIMVADGTTAALSGITISSAAASNFLILSTSAPLPVGAAAGTGVQIRSRQPANGVNTSNQVVQDNGTEIVAGSVQVYSSTMNDLGPRIQAPTRTNFIPGTAGAPGTYDYTTIRGNILAGQGPKIFGILADNGIQRNVFIADLVTSNSSRSVVPFLSYLDLQSAPGFANLQNQFITPDLFGNTPIAADAALRGVVAQGAAPRTVLEQAFTPVVPRSENAITPPDTNLAAAVREQLQVLGIYARALTPEERRARELWVAKFVAIPGKVRPSESEYQVADARVEDLAVREVLRAAAEAGLLGGESEARLTEIAEALKISYETYTTFSPAEDRSLEQLISEYRQWILESDSPESQKVLVYLKALGTAFKRIELLGLTRQELEISKAQIYGIVLRNRLNIEPEFLRGLVESLENKAPIAQQEDKPAAPAEQSAPAQPTPAVSTESALD